MMSAILKEDPPDLSHLNDNVSPALDRLVSHCLEKNPQERFHSVRDLGFALETISGTSGQTVTSAAPLRARSKNRERLVWIVVTAALLVITLLAIFFPLLRQAQTEAHAVRFNITLPEKATFYSDVETHNLAVSPDGRQLTFIAAKDNNRSLWLYSLDEFSPQPVPGTEGAYSPFWSPDNRYVAFFSQGKLKRLEISGLSVQTLCSLSGEIDTVGTWGEGVILFNDQFNEATPSSLTSAENSSAAIYSVPATGGTPALLTKSKKFKTTWVHFLPDGKRFLFYGRGDQPDTNGIYAASLDSPDGNLVLKIGYTRVEYAPPGYLLYAREGSLLAQPFNGKNLRATGEPLTVVTRMPYFDKTGWAEFSASKNSVLAYASNLSITRLVWFDRNGREVGQVGASGKHYGLRISPDGERLALTISDERTGSSDIWTHDLAHDTRTRFVFGPTDDGDAVWSPDGRRLAFFSCCEGASTLYIKDLNDPGKGQSPLPAGFRSPWDWSADGKFILYSENDPTTNRDIWVLPVDREQKPYPLFQTEFMESYAQFSPNGRWVAYVSNETGNDELYVARFDNPRERRRISTAGAAQPRWRRDGKELFYLAGDKSLMAVPVKAGDNFETGEAISLFKLDSTVENSYDVSVDGQRFLVNTAERTTQSMPFTVVLNWTSDLKR
jgi:Tol biopolymer transport system component